MIKYALLIAAILSPVNAVADCYSALSWPHANESTVTFDASGYTECGTPIEGERTAVIIVMGQSLATNTVNAAYTPTHDKNEQINIYDGKCYKAKGKALGVSGLNASWIGARLGDILIDRGLYDRVITVPMAIGGTWVVEWKNTSVKPWLGLRIKNIACMVQNYGLAPTHVVWMQGESDTYSGTSQASYTASLRTIIGTIRGAGITSPILVNLESWLSGATSAAVRNAQMSVVGTNGVIQGANMDSLNNSYRYDGTHLNASGALAAANLLADIVAANQ